MGNHFIREGLEKQKTINQLMEDWLFLQQNCGMYINSEAPGLVPGNGPAPKPIRALTQRLKGKHGRFRGNIFILIFPNLKINFLLFILKK